ncbi:hypothetical protein RB195_018329 [Necator americanus]
MKLGETITAEEYCKELNGGQNAKETPTSSAGVSEQRRPGSPTRQCPAAHSKATVLKLNELDYRTLPRPLYSSDLADYHFFQHLDSYLRGKLFQNQADAENYFEKFMDSKSSDFRQRVQATLYLVGKDAWRLERFSYRLEKLILGRIIAFRSECLKMRIFAPT